MHIVRFVSAIPTTAMHKHISWKQVGTWFWRDDGTRSTPASILRALGILSVGVALNLAGAGIHYAFHLPIYVDMTGTAVLSLLFGPIQGAVCGMLSNIAGAALFHQPDYFRFSIVHIPVALTIGILPRIFKDKLNLFDPNKGYARTFSALITLGASAAIASAVVSILVMFKWDPSKAFDSNWATFIVGDQAAGSLTITTAKYLEYIVSGHAQSNNLGILIFARLLFELAGKTTCIILAFAIIVLKFERCWYKMDGPFERVFHYNRAIPMFIWLMLYIAVFFSYMTFNHDKGDENITMIFGTPVMHETIKTNAIILIWLVPIVFFVGALFDKTRFAPDIPTKDHVYLRPYAYVDEIIRDAFEGVLVIYVGVIVVCAYPIFASSSPVQTILPNDPKTFAEFRSQLLGVTGAAGLITVLRYLISVSIRAKYGFPDEIRLLGEPTVGS
jgi:hypothetical protein